MTPAFKKKDRSPGHFEKGARFRDSTKERIVKAKHRRV